MLHRLIINSSNFRKIIDLQESFYTIGRHSTNSIILPSPKISKKHAIIVKISGEKPQKVFQIIDGDEQGNRSKNGIFVNGKKVLKHQLKHGDIINFDKDIKVTYYIIHVTSNYFINLPASETSFQPSTEVFVNAQWDQTETEEKQILLPESYLSKLASLVEFSPNPIIEINFAGEITYLNSAAIQKFKTIQKEKINHPIFRNLLEQEFHQDGNLLIREIKIGQEIFEQHIHYLNDSQLIRSYIFDITERKLAEEILHYQAYYDTLTGLPNKILFNQQLATALADAHFKNTLLAVLFIDLDGFQNVNDTLGHSTGDQLLRSFAQRLKTRLCAGDFFARWAGDEFTILVPYLENIEEAKNLAQRIFNILQQPFNISDNLLYLKASIGIAIYPQDGEDAETLVKNADAALYRSKEIGKNNYQFYNPIITSKSCQRLQIENLLHQALEKEQFLLHYQPQINIKTGQVLGMEALIRWQHPELGLISPTKFIPIAEETGLIVNIGEWVLRQACLQNQFWQKMGLPPIRIAVNLSPQQFQQPNFINVVTQILKETDLEAHFLELEITETTIMENIDFACQVISYFQTMGVHISMDDFGTGYSSLGYLKQIPLNSIKIDQTFVKDLKEHPQDLAIISAVLAIGRGFNLRVIAEGVETQYQVDLLKKLECEEMQGFKFSKPLTPEDAAKFLWSSPFNS
ncbi:EAL domain-containing protein [Gloeothece verrucosa]|uniref:Diguanylate cyclase/phosphodiesterase with PAS/PAC sensor(S) n=1 Tax=Gloeothece verrucosa (strain PCC 7822) TaxID=497965 RepID=E0UH64_GLOV7|nr:EAL domain-containing protein [Gloeothece verrucosa]ADN15663.1 diguanylate cyclase/phosphodiesterase with PAS/PAC sensor(s) [Gloeothece verrucosa PCC 7822]